jgi:hypothetical protein
MTSNAEMRETEAYRLGKSEGAKESQSELAKRLLLSDKFDHSEIARLTGLPLTTVMGIHGALKHGWPTGGDSPGVIYVEDLIGNEETRTIGEALVAMLEMKIKVMEEKLRNGPEWTDMVERSLGSIEMAEFLLKKGDCSMETMIDLTGLPEKYITHIRDKLAARPS